jgi:DNA-binding LacI/PurR family transcriptional regulator
MNVPGDVSVIGFDDIRSVSFHNPRLTTIRQPLINMGRIAAQCVLNRLHGTEGYREQIVVEPELMVRESTGVVCASPSTIRTRENKKPAKPVD